MKDTIFREYDIRGVVGKELTLDHLYDLGCALAFYFKEHLPSCNTISIAMDGRTHSSSIKTELTRAFIDSGINVVFLGVCPTPAMYFSLYTMQVDGGIMITASHNGPTFNGMKICLGKTVIWGKELQKIKSYFHERKKVAATNEGAETTHEIVPAYVSWLADHFKEIQNISVNAVIDCGNGAAGTVMPALIGAMGWQNVKLLYEEVDGTFPNHEADPTVIKNMQVVKKQLSNESFEIGIGLDGDCDRMVPMTKEGFLVPGDQLLALFAENLLKNHPGAGIVFDIKSSSGLIELLEQWGAKPIMSPSGHSIIKDMMSEHGALLGGELSCHFFFKDRYFGYDDGIYATLRLIEILHTTKKSLTALLSIFPKKYSSREFRLYCPDENKKKVINALKKQLENRGDISLITMDGVRATFPFGWGIIRASNTQPALSMRFESETKSGLEQLMHLFAELLDSHLSKEALAELKEEIE